MQWKILSEIFSLSWCLCLERYLPSRLAIIYWGINYVSDIVLRALRKWALKSSAPWEVGEAAIAQLRNLRLRVVRDLPNQGCQPVKWYTGALPHRLKPYYLYRIRMFRGEPKIIWDPLSYSSAAGFRGWAPRCTSSSHVYTDSQTHRSENWAE